MENNKADAVRIQTSVLNATEKKVLVYLAERQPKWMTSDILTYIGTFGAIVIAAGYILSDWNINYLCKYFCRLLPRPKPNRPPEPIAYKDCKI